MLKLFDQMKIKDVITGSGITDLAQLCASQLNYQHVSPDEDGGIPWWLAIVIAIPLIVITVAVIKIVMIVKEKRRRRFEEEMARYNRLTPGQQAAQSITKTNSANARNAQPTRLSITGSEDSDHNPTI